MSCTSSAPNGQSPTRYWPLLAPYVVPSISAGLAIVAAFPDLVAKSALQMGVPIPSLSAREWIKGGASAVRNAGLLVGSQLVFQNVIENNFKKALMPDSNQGEFLLKLTSAAFVGMISTPFVAIFNGQTIPGGSVMSSLKSLSTRQCAAITIQETFFVAGLTAAALLHPPIKQWMGDNKAAEHTANFVSGALGSLAGHPFNTALTRWQRGMTINFHQLTWGAARKARGIGIFAVGYAFWQEVFKGGPQRMSDL